MDGRARASTQAATATNTTTPLMAKRRGGKESPKRISLVTPAGARLSPLLLYQLRNIWHCLAQAMKLAPAPRSANAHQKAWGARKCIAIPPPVDNCAVKNGCPCRFSDLGVTRRSALRFVAVLATLTATAGEQPLQVVDGDQVVRVECQADLISGHGFVILPLIGIGIADHELNGAAELPVFAPQLAVATRASGVGASEFLGRFTVFAVAVESQSLVKLGRDAVA